MAGKRILMGSLKQVLLLRNLGTGKKTIARQTGVSKAAINEYLDVITRKGYVLQDLVQMEEPVLEGLFFNAKEIEEVAKYNLLKELFPSFAEELSEVGINRMFLWQEYKQTHPGGYGYSQFCYHYQQWSTANKTTLHIEQKPGDKVYIDFAGKKMAIVFPLTGEMREVETFVATLGFSGLTYVEFCESQAKEDFIHCAENALHYFGGVPLACVPDNLKSGVTKACRYAPHLAKDFEDMANHYNLAIVPARSRKPRDKAWVERMVNIIYTRIYAPLRHEAFHNIRSMNQARLPLLEKHNDMKMQDRDDSRRSLFDREESHLLSPLPKGRFELKSYLKLTAGTNYHVYLKREKHYYSVPHRYCGKRLDVLLTAKQVCIYYKGEQIAMHLKGISSSRYTTNPDHMPENHKYVLGLSPEKLIERGEQISPDVKLYIQAILNKPMYCEQAFKSCEGILAYVRKAGKERLIAACQRGIMFNTYTYSFIRNTITNGMDRADTPEDGDVQFTLPLHDNIRGSQEYK